MLIANAMGLALLVGISGFVVPLVALSWMRASSHHRLSQRGDPGWAWAHVFDAAFGTPPDSGWPEVLASLQRVSDAAPDPELTRVGHCGRGWLMHPDLSVWRSPDRDRSLMALVRPCSIPSELLGSLALPGEEQGWLAHGVDGRYSVLRASELPGTRTVSSFRRPELDEAMGDMPLF